MRFLSVFICGHLWFQLFRELRLRSARRLASLALFAIVVCVGIASHAAEPVIPPPRGFVNDFARVIDAPTARALEAMIGELQAKTGSEIAIVTVDSTQPLSAFD